MKHLTNNLHNKLGQPPELININDLEQFLITAKKVVMLHPDLHGAGFEKQANNPSDITEDLAQAYICHIWFKSCVFGNNLNKTCTSYSFKHRVEEWLKLFPTYPLCYISNGAFILAYLITGNNFKIEERNIFTTIKAYPNCNCQLGPLDIIS